MDEVKLAKKAIHGNAKAYGQLIELYKEVFYKTAFLHVKNEDTALDIVSETIMRGFQAVHKLREPQLFKTWMIRILLNVTTDYFRKYRETDGMEDMEKIPAQESGIGIEERMDIYHAIEMLPNQYKSVIILKFYNDLKIREIASVLEMPEGTVKANLHYGKETLKKYLKEDYLYV